MTRVERTTLVSSDRPEFPDMPVAVQWTSALTAFAITFHGRIAPIGT